MATSPAATGSTTHRPAIAEHSPASAPSGEQQAPTAPTCELCEIRPATTTGPITVDGVVIATEPLCEQCRPTDDDDIVAFAARLIEELDYPLGIVDDLELHVADVSQALGVRAAVETYSRRHDL